MLITAATWYMADLPAMTFVPVAQVWFGDQLPDILLRFLLNCGEHIIENLKKLLSGKAVEGDQVVRLRIFKADDWKGGLCDYGKRGEYRKDVKVGKIVHVRIVGD